MGWMSSYQVRPKQPWRLSDLPSLYVMHHRGQSRSPVGMTAVKDWQPARPGQQGDRTAWPGCLA